MSEQKRPNTQLVLATLVQPEFKAKVAASLPKGMDPDRFTRMTITAIQNKPELLEADKESLYLAILQCAQTGLAPDGKEAALVVFKTKDGNSFVKKVQFMPMVTGIIKKLGEVDVKCDTNVVYENDFFEYEAGDDERITHRPAKMGHDRGMLIGCYAILRVKGIDTPYREVMDTVEVEAVRAQSRAPDSLMWTQFRGEAYRKTVLRRCAKRIPMRFEETLEATLNADDRTFDMGAAPTARAEPEPAQEAPAALEQVNHQEDDRVVSQQAAKAPAEQQAASRPKAEPKPKAAPPPVEESENPAPQQERRAPAATAAGTTPARPKALAAVIESSDSDEDIF